MTATGLAYQAPPMLQTRVAFQQNWSWRRIKNASVVNRQALPDDTDPDHAFKYVDIGTVDSDGHLGEAEWLTFGTAPSRARRLVLAGDSIVSTVRTYLRAIAYIDDDADDLVVSTGFATLTPTDVDERFLYWWLRSTPFIEEIVARSVGVSYPAVNGSDVEDVALAAPGTTEQSAIARFLDSETTKIDALISEQIHFDALLAERRQAAVFDAVTGRSIRGVRRGDVPWVDSVPAAWEVTKLLRVAQLGSGHTPARNRPELWEDCTIPWITTGEVWQIRSDVQEVLTETREMISELGVAESSAVVHPKGTVVLCRTAASAGYSAIMGLDMATSQDFATWTCGPELDPYFLLYCLRGMRRDLLERLAFGSTHRTIYMPEVKSIIVPLPPIDEQRVIVAELKEELQRIDRLRTEIAEQIDLLREHRQALITAAVTGGSTEVAA